ncbi:hypothetical protein C8R47DRAFT_1198439, partial [Mycena vitilis]
MSNIDGPQLESLAAADRSEVFPLPQIRIPHTQHATPPRLRTMRSAAVPMLSSSVPFSYRYDRSLKCMATRYYHTASLDTASGDDPGLTLLFAGGIGLNQEAWQPAIRELLRLASLPAATVKIHFAWIIERPNHGDAVLLNAPVLEEHYPEMFKNMHYATAIQTFLETEILSPAEKSSIVGVGFSGGCPALQGTGRTQALELLNKHRTNDTPFFRMLIFLESSWAGPEAFPFFESLYPSLRNANLRRPKSWGSVDEASGSEAMHTYFCPDPKEQGRIVTKTTAEQETATFVDDGSPGTSLKYGLPYMRTVLHMLPVHLVFGACRDFWLPEIQRCIATNVEQDRASSASVSFIEGVRHHVCFPKGEMCPNC